MKAIVMAGGEGTRLRPLTAACPKPMIRLFDRPVLEYILHLLNASGIRDVYLTLKYLPDAVTAYFGDGSSFGVNLQSRVEDSPLGTAGGVRACLDFIGGDDVLVISGDCVCDFDLRSCIDFHKTSGSEATIVLYNHPHPPEYGLVVTDAHGRIERFVEKPPWEKVVTGDISTGIYILSPQIVRSIPDGAACDFGCDLFPRLLRDGRRLFAVRAEGYWCDIGSPESYLRCCADVLSGAVRLPGSPPVLNEGLWTSSALPCDAVSERPVYVGENSAVEAGARLGPNAVIGSGSFIGSGASVKNSVIDGAVVKPGAVIDGAFVGRGTVVGMNAALGDGCVIGENCVLGDGCSVSERVKIWPSREVPAGARVTGNVTDVMPVSALAFSPGGAIRGVFGSALTPEACLSVGSASAASGMTGVAHDGSSAAAAMATAVSCGAVSAGGRVLLLDAPYAAAAAFAGGLYGLETTVFCSSANDESSLSFFEALGSPVTRSAERRLEASLRGDLKHVPAHAVGAAESVTGVCEALAACAAAEYGGRPALVVSVPGRSAENRTLRTAFREAGCILRAPWGGVPSFEVSAGGFHLSASDEEGCAIDQEHMLLITALAAFETGHEEIAAPFSAPAALEKLAKETGRRVLRLELGGKEASSLYAKQPFMRFAAFSAALICRVMREKNATLKFLRESVPRFSTAAREVTIGRARGDIMSAMLASCAEMSTELCDGFAAFNGSSGRVRVTPYRDRECLLIRAEGETAELAEELCADFEHRARTLDTKKS